MLPELPPEPKEWGFLFKGPLALAVHAGTKTQTRRLVGPRLFSVDGGPWPKGWTFDLARARLENGPSPAGNAGPYLVAQRTGADTIHRLYPRIQVGHRIWAKETWGLHAPFDLTEWHRGSLVDAAGLPDGWELDYRADWHRDDESCCWRPSILMPRWAARSVREVVSVGLERLQAITPEAAIAEGLTAITKDGGRTIKYGIPDRDGLPGTDDTGWPWEQWEGDPRRALARLWDSINGDQPGANWISNPWVLPIGWRATAETAGRAA